MLILPDHWVWDFWFADHGAERHVFFLKAPTALGDPELRHRNARIGHAVSTDLRSWTLLPDALAPGPDGAWDDIATWTGSVIRSGDRWHMFYTGISSREAGRVQRIGRAVSTDLVTWIKDDGPVVEADGRWYELLDLDAWHEQAWRDPWVYWDDETCEYRMLITARAPDGPADGRGVVGAARSDDLVNWEVLPPVSEPGEFGHLEVPQLVTVGGRCYVVFSVYGFANSAAWRQRRPEVTGTHYLMGESPAGPFRMVTDEFLCGDARGELYAGRMTSDVDGRLVLMAFVQYPNGEPFVGALSDPIPVEVAEDGALRVEPAGVAAATTGWGLRRGGQRGRNR